MYLIIELSNTKIKATLAVDKTRVVKHYVAREIPDGIVQNGYIIKPEEMQSHLRVVLTEFPKVKGCVFLLNSTDLFQKELIVPVAKPAAVRTVVQNQMNTIIGTGKDYSIDYDIRDTIEQEGAKVYRVAAYAVPVSILQAYITIAQNVGLKLLGIDVPVSALNKVLRGATINGSSLQGRTTLMMKLGYKHINMYLIEDGVCAYSRTVDFETQDYLETIRQIDPSAGFETISLNPTYAQQFGRIQEMLDPMTGGIVDEIFRLQQYTYSRQGSQPISTVYIDGPMSSINGMIEYLNSNVDVPVQKVESVSTLYIEGAIYASDVLISSGAADIKGINLAKSVPGLFDDVKGFGMNDTIKYNIPVLIVLVLLIGGFFGFKMVQNNKIESDTKKIQKTMASDEYKEQIEEAKLLESNKSVYGVNKLVIQSFIANFEENNLFQKPTMDQIFSKTPAGMEFITITYSDGRLNMYCRIQDNELAGAQFARGIRDLFSTGAVKYVDYTSAVLEVVGEERDDQGNITKAGTEYYTFELTVGLKEEIIETTTTKTTTTTGNGETTTETTTEGV